MKTMLITLVLLGCSVEALAAPVKVPAMKVCVDGSGAITARKKCKGGETALDAAALSAMVNGGIDVDKCQVWYDTVSDSGYGRPTLECGAGEYMLSHGIEAPNDDDFEVQEIRLITDPAARYPKGVEYVLYGSGDWTADVVICCCPK